MSQAMIEGSGCVQHANRPLKVSLRYQRGSQCFAEIFSLQPGEAPDLEQQAVGAGRGAQEVARQLEGAVALVGAPRRRAARRAGKRTTARTTQRVSRQEVREKKEDGRGGRGNDLACRRVSTPPHHPPPRSSITIDFRHHKY